MSDAPISGADPADHLRLARAGWSEADLDWERRMERAALHDLAGEAADAATEWAAALALAREHFADDDPRLAASLSNHALGLARAGDTALARRLFDEALRVWDRGGSWLAGLRPERRARSSLFHFRMEIRNRETYAENARARGRRLAAEGRAATLALRDGGGAGDGRMARWRSERPAMLCDFRKLLAAVLLIAPGPG